MKGQALWYTRNTVKKRVCGFPVPSQDDTYQTPPGRGIIVLFQARDSLVSDSPAGDGKISNLFL